MKVKARCDETVTIVVDVYRRSIWLSVTPFFNGEGILEPENVDSLVNILNLAAKEARSYKP